MPVLPAHDGHHGGHRLHLVHRPARAERLPARVREARAVTGLVALATGVFGALWICAAAGLADTGWWRGIVVLAAVAFAGLAVAALGWMRR